MVDVLSARGTCDKGNATVFVLQAGRSCLSFFQLSFKVTRVRAYKHCFVTSKKAFVPWSTCVERCSTRGSCEKRYKEHSFERALCHQENVVARVHELFNTSTCKKNFSTFLHRLPGQRRVPKTVLSFTWEEEKNRRRSKAGTLTVLIKSDFTSLLIYKQSLLWNCIKC